MKREDEAGLEPRCAFCRDPAPESDEERDKNIMERIEKNDPFAMAETAKKLYREGDRGKALEYWTKAAELGDADAHAQLSSWYHYAHGGVKDTKKSIYHAEQAAIAGHPKARYNLGVNEAKGGRHDRAVKHFIIAASVGYQHSLKTLEDLYGEGYARKEDYDSALRAGCCR